MKNKIKTGLNIVCIVVFLAILVVLLWRMSRVKTVDMPDDNMTGAVVEMDSVFGYVIKGNIDKVEDALESGTDINIVNLNNHQNLLHYALIYGQYDIAEYLIEKGIKTDQCDIYGNTPVMLVVYAGRQELFDMLKEDVNLNAVDAMGNTLLHLCAAGGSVEIYEYLYSKGIDINAKNKQNKESLYYAYDGEMLEYIMDKMKITELDDTMKRELLFTAVSGKMIDYLIENDNADINAEDENGNNALYYAVVNGNLSAFEELIKKGIDVDNRNAEGYTVLHLCAEENAVDFARLLLVAKANKSIKNNIGKTAYDLAESHGNQEMAELLGGK